MSRRTTRAMAALIALAGLSTAACGLPVTDLPLPKPSVDGDSYELKADFDNALNLPNDAKVKINGTDVGVVTDITTSDFKAHVTMQIEDAVELPKEGTSAELRQATPLGDVYVALSMKQHDAGAAMLTSGDTISQTSAGASVEQLLMQAATLINGGTLVSAADILNEVNSMVEGRGPTIQHLIQKLTSVTTTLNERTDALDGTLKQTDTLLSTLNSRSSELGSIADSIPGMIDVLAQNNQTIGDLLAKTAVASDALADFADTSGDDLNTMLASLGTVMSGISGWGDKLEQFADIIHEFEPKLDAATRSTSLTTELVVSALSIGPIWDPSGSKWPGLDDLNAMVVSLADVLGHVYSRITGNY